VEADEERAAVGAAVADESFNIDGVHQTLRVGIAQQIQGFVQGDLATQSVLHAPSARVPGVKAGLQHVLAVIVGVADPVREAAGAGGYAVIVLASQEVDEVLLRLGVFGKRPGVGPHRREGEAQLAPGAAPWPARYRNGTVCSRRAPSR
jgi:hypothetical protein